MIISHKYKFIFVKTRKTAGSSLQTYFGRHCGDSDIITPIDKPEGSYKAQNYRGLFNPVPRMQEQYPSTKKMLRTLWRCVSLNKFNSHIMATHIKRRIPEDIWKSYYKFTVDRNPWDKVLSHYHFIRQRYSEFNEDISFDEYLEKAELPYNYQIYTDDNKQLLVDRVIKFESLDEELGDVFGGLGVPYEGSLNVFEKSHYRKKKKNYQESYTESQKKLVADKFAFEIKLHGYNF